MSSDSREIDEDAREKFFDKILQQPMHNLHPESEFMDNVKKTAVLQNMRKIVYTIATESFCKLPRDYDCDPVLHSAVETLSTMGYRRTNVGFPITYPAMTWPLDNKSTVKQ